MVRTALAGCGGETAALGWAALKIQSPLGCRSGAVSAGLTVLQPLGLPSGDLVMARIGIALGRPSFPFESAIFKE